MTKASSLHFIFPLLCSVTNCVVGTSTQNVTPDGMEKENLTNEQVLVATEEEDDDDEEEFVGQEGCPDEEDFNRSALGTVLLDMKMDVVRLCM